MRFMFPLAFLGLLAIPAIILIYILNSKYTEQTVTSTYLWNLSDKFMKRKNPLSGITGIIGLILQILTVIIITLVLAHPIFILPGAAKNYCFVLDASSSMNTEEGKETRFEMAQDEIAKVIRKSKRGSSYSLVCVSDESVIVFESVKDKDLAIELVEKTKPTHTTADHKSVLDTAQNLFDKDNSSLIYLVTDKSYKEHKNVEKVINVASSDVHNAAVYGADFSHFSGKLTVNAKAISYVRDTTVTVDLIVDGNKAATKAVTLTAGEETDFTIEAQTAHYESFTLEIRDVDAYMLDNSVSSYNLKSDKSYSILIVSKASDGADVDNPGFFLKAAIDSHIDSEIVVVTPEKYETMTEKYGLYVFENYSPSTLPDGAVWLINPDENIESSGFSVKGKISIADPQPIQLSKNTSTQVRKLLEGLDDDDIYVANYLKFSGMYLNFHTLYSHDSNPLIFAGANGLGNRQVVFGFDLHDSDMPLSVNFAMLVRNLLQYSFPDVVDKSNYTVGDDALVNIVANANSITASSPSGEDIYMETDGSSAVLKLDEIGTYTITLDIAGANSVYRIYSAADLAESVPSTEEASFSLSGERTNKNIDGEFDPIIILFITLILLFIADWGVYIYEKYQLR